MARLFSEQYETAINNGVCIAAWFCLDPENGCHDSVDENKGRRLLGEY